MVASLVPEHGLQACELQKLWHVGSVVAVSGLQSLGSVFVGQGLGCSVARKRSSMPQPKTRPDSPVPSLQGPCDRSLKSEEP